MLIAKLHTYGFDLSSLKLIQAEIKGTKSIWYSSWKKILFQPHKDLFLILYYLIFFCVTCYGQWAKLNCTTDDTTPYVSEKSVDDAIKSLEVIL